MDVYSILHHETPVATQGGSSGRGPAFSLDTTDLDKVSSDDSSTWALPSPDGEWKVIRSVRKGIDLLTADQARGVLTYLMDMRAVSVTQLLAGIRAHADRVESQDRDWNREYQELVDSMHDDHILMELKKFKKLSSLAQDFLYAAETYGKVIISEKYLPISEKTIRPVDVGGFAGGQKYIVHNILFKFAIDNTGLYDGSDEHAAKVAGNEMRALRNVLSASIEGLHVPLMAVIDYRGFRLTAMSYLPISDETLVYGSSDAGRHVFTKNPTFNDMMKQLGDRLCLKGHMAGVRQDHGKLVYGPCDVEGHQGNGEDKRFYLVDLARLFPPVPPLNITAREGNRLLLRPELIRRYGVPLSSDAFSKFSYGYPEAVEEEEDVCRIYYKLMTVVIPEFAHWLGQQEPEKDNGSKWLSQQMHTRGINIRFLGTVRHLVTSAAWKAILLEEMIARSAKNGLRARLRAMMEEVKLPAEQPYRRCCAMYFNLVFSNRDESRAYWLNELRSDVDRRYGPILVRKADPPPASAPAPPIVTAGSFATMAAPTRPTGLVPHLEQSPFGMEGVAGAEGDPWEVLPSPVVQRGGAVLFPQLAGGGGVAAFGDAPVGGIAFPSLGGDSSAWPELDPHPHPTSPGPAVQFDSVDGLGYTRAPVRSPLAGVAGSAEFGRGRVPPSRAAAPNPPLAGEEAGPGHGNVIIDERTMRALRGDVDDVTPAAEEAVAGPPPQGPAGSPLRTDVAPSAAGMASTGGAVASPVAPAAPLRVAIPGVASAGAGGTFPTPSSTTGTGPLPVFVDSAGSAFGTGLPVGQGFFSAPTPDSSTAAGGFFASGDIAAASFPSLNAFPASGFAFQFGGGGSGASDVSGFESANIGGSFFGGGGGDTHTGALGAAGTTAAGAVGGSASTAPGLVFPPLNTNINTAILAALQSPVYSPVGSSAGTSSVHSSISFPPISPPASIRTPTHAPKTLATPPRPLAPTMSDLEVYTAMPPAPHPPAVTLPAVINSPQRAPSSGASTPGTPGEAGARAAPPTPSTARGSPPPTPGSAKGIPAPHAATAKGGHPPQPPRRKREPISLVEEPGPPLPLEMRAEFKSLCSLFVRVVGMTGIRFSPGAYQELSTDINVYRRDWPIETTDIIDMPEQVKQLHTIDYAEGTVQFIQARTLKQNKQDSEATRKTAIARAKFDAVLQVISDPATLTNYGFLTEDIEGDVDRALDLYRQAYEADPKHARSLYYTALVYERKKKDYDKAEDFYERAVNANPHHINANKDFANFLNIIRNNVERADRHYAAAVRADKELSNAKAHLMYADFLRTRRGDWAACKRHLESLLTIRETGSKVPFGLRPMLIKMSRDEKKNGNTDRVQFIDHVMEQCFPKAAKEGDAD